VGARSEMNSYDKIYKLLIEAPDPSQPDEEKPINRVYQMASGSAKENALFKQHMADKRARMEKTSKILAKRKKRKKK